MQEARTVAFHTLGCKLNYSESSSLSRLLENEGFVRREFDDSADIYVINTCSVTENADRECRQIVRRIQRRNPESLVVVTGCYAQLKPQQIAAIPGVDLVLGAAEKFNIAEHLRDLQKTSGAKICSCDIEDVTEFHSSWSFHDRTRTFLKVQDGCDYNCSFCTIPLARGKSRSDSISKVVHRAYELASQGVKEIVLTGVNLGDFGAQSGRRGDVNFFALMQELEKVEGIKRYRISSIEPNLLSNEIIEFVANSDRFMPHFHIPLQSGSNRILALMRRRYRRELYEERVKLIRALMPHCAVGADVIVGFPGETEEDFCETFEFLHELEIAYLHVFTYSERDHTLAPSLGHAIPLRIRQERNKILRNLSYMKSQWFRERHRGQTRKVLFEGGNHGPLMEGYTDNYIRVSCPFRADWVNQVVEFTV
ncbi:MAG TPA: tRNA (N(6)-L-threonylcarbamoyladenosine(37)-C(2))-methylthiotransferase MtaB [Chitinophagaceae bacterium]|nr:tRNA (N(6)-L-threonylcarbamoyladenosine(37)-C(2))-methylthiotransferase MtaB [Chitinophagaceae bacterium]